MFEESAGETSFMPHAFFTPFPRASKLPARILKIEDQQGLSDIVTITVVLFSFSIIVHHVGGDSLKLGNKDFL